MYDMYSVVHIRSVIGLARKARMANVTSSEDFNRERKKQINIKNKIANLQANVPVNKIQNGNYRLKFITVLISAIDNLHIEFNSILCFV